MSVAAPAFVPADLALIRRMNAEESLLDFIKQAWHAVEPATPFVSGWAVDAICEHLEAVSNDEIFRLIINVPPGFMKSLTANVFWPAWEWGPRGAASTRYISASYSSSLTERDNLRMCQLIHSPWYQEHWGYRFKANESSIQVKNDKTGWKAATSVGGVGTGLRGDRVVIDDANSVKQAESQTVLASTNQWIREVMPTRLSDPQTGAIINIQQRTNEADATGTLLTDGGDYVHLMIPMEFDGRKYVNGIGWEDPRSVEDIDPTNMGREWWRVRGELAFPERFPVWVVERDKRAMGTYATSGQFQQMPSPRGGGIIKMEWWKQWGPDNPRGLKFPPFDLVMAFYDGAYTTKTQNDPSACAVMGTFMDNYRNPDPDADHTLSGMPKVMLANCWAERLALNDVVRKIDETCRKYRVSILLVENKANGHSVVQELHRLFVEKPYSVVLVDPGSSDKVARAMSVVPLFEDGMIYAPNTEWAVAAKEELGVFPRGAHDDRVDAIVGALRWLRDNAMLKRQDEVLVEEREAMIEEDERARWVPLYRC